MDYYSEEKEILIEERKKVRRETALLYIQARKKRNLTQEELAKRLEVKRPNVARFESGDYNPTLDMLVKIAQCMGLKLEISLVEESGEKENG
ncbi:MAG TPA: helix-turn-helix transcriptional regulator [Candidatus Blautia merdavium]|uniref:Helix-turn-helix transcriptional regulator n=1 Tax=Candidatus Blautia merdavium TaxID=2838494 RepID=A0A9D2PRA9_9FIRM|nr:helix-turn-helix transcriptional regulator [Candidatus Blautia merdavium]